MRRPSKRGKAQQWEQLAFDDYDTWRLVESSLLPAWLASNDTYMRRVDDCLLQGLSLQTLTIGLEEKRPGRLPPDDSCVRARESVVMRHRLQGDEYTRTGTPKEAASG